MIIFIVGIFLGWGITAMAYSDTIEGIKLTAFLDARDEIIKVHKRALKNETKAARKQGFETGFEAGYSEGRSKSLD